MSAGKKGQVRWSEEQLQAFLKRTGQPAERFGGKVERSEPKTEPPAAGEGVKLLRKRRKVMNQTEGRMADVLEARKRRGEILSYRFEGMTLRWGQNEDFTYTPDFTVIVAQRPLIMETGSVLFHRVRFIEVKGAHIRERAWLQFKAARDAHPFYEFELWQWKGGTWTRLA